MRFPQQNERELALKGNSSPRHAWKRKNKEKTTKRETNRETNKKSISMTFTDPYISL